MDPVLRIRATVLGAVLVVLAAIVAGCDAPAESPSGSDGGSTQPPAEHSSSVVSEDLVQPDDFEYLGAFRLPEDAERPQAFAYGGEAMTFNPAGDPGGADDGHPGSLYVMGHPRLAYGELPDGSQVAEVSIPEPVVADSVTGLGQASFVQGFADVAAGHFAGMDEIPRAGMEYLDCPESGPRIHLSWGQHLQDDAATDVASHAYFSPDLSSPDMQGPWFIGEQSPHSVNDYLFEIPAEWAERYVEGRPLATGRYRDGGWGGMGPQLFAYSPWTEGDEPAAEQTRLEEIPLLAYAKSDETEDIERCLDGYQHADEWGGGAWLTTTDASAVMFAGTKATGSRYWYGYVNPVGPEHPCVEEELIGSYALCRLADGTPVPDEESLTCDSPASLRGWWSARFDARFIFYDPADLARVATGEMEPWEPQPYAYLDIDEELFLSPGIEPEMLGSGVQRRYRIGDVAFDRANGLVYVLELFAEDARPVVHAWSVE